MIEIKSVEKFYLDGKKIKNKNDFMNEISVIMEFPSNTFMKNYDSLIDCLTDLSWIPAKKYELHYNDSYILKKNSPADYDKIISILETIVSYWEGNDIKFLFYLN